MIEHAIELVSLLTAFAGSLLWIIWWFLKRDRRTIDLSLDRMERKVDDNASFYEKKLRDALETLQGKMDRTAESIDKKAEAGIQRVCSKAEEVRTVAQDARGKAYALEINYTKRFSDVHQHLAEVELRLLKENGELKDLLIERFVTKDELRDLLLKQPRIGQLPEDA